MVVNESKIDSFKLFVPYDKCTMTNIDNYINVEVSKGTGDIKREKAPSIFFSRDGIKSSISLCTESYYGGRMVEGFKIAVHAKMLGCNYFDGISVDNISIVYDFINSMSDDFQINSIDGLMSSRVSDIDFCLDSSYMSISDFSDFCEGLRYMCREVGVSNYNFKNANEFYVSDRKANISAPFLKFYRKGVEYIGSDHQTFYFDDCSMLKDITRSEVTIKNQKALRRYSKGRIRSSRLKDVIRGDYSMIVPNIISHYFGKSKRVFNGKRKVLVSDLKPSELVIHSNFSYLLSMPKFKSALGSELGCLSLISEVYEMNTFSIKCERKKRDKRKLIERVFYEHFDSFSSGSGDSFKEYIDLIGLSN